MFGRRLVIVALILVGGCRCETIDVQKLSPGQLRFMPERVSFEATFIGSTRTTSLEVFNTQGGTVDAEVSIGEPFAADVTSVSLVRAAATTINLTFTPNSAGVASGVLKIGNLELAVEGEGLEPPACTTENVCASVRFDFDTAQCIQTQRENGTSCESACVTGGCEAGVCTGAIKSCDDGDLCTIDACAESSGCTHTPRSCPAPTNPCKAPTCDSVNGCGEADVQDGTLCGADDCTASNVDVCIAGACVSRTRPDLGRCANRWVSISIPVRHSHSMAFDSLRNRVVVFGGASTGNPRSDTWEWDGRTWSERLPIASPPGTEDAAMSFDPLRGRVVLFGGTPSSSDTWEWDGTTWLRRSTIGPSARWAHAMAWDPVRRRTLLYGGVGSTVVGDTWEWDGSTWVQRSPQRSPGPRQFPSMAWDPVRQRMVLFGGYFGGLTNDTWEWDGLTWTERTPAQSPPSRSGASLAWNAVSNRLVLFGGVGGSNAPLIDQWEWDGANWTERPLGTARPFEAAPMVWDSVQQRNVLFGGGRWAGARNETWAFDGTAWHALETPQQLARYSTALAWDSTRQRAVLFGGSIPLPGPFVTSDDTWEWSSGDWLSTNALTRPSRRTMHALAGTGNGVLLFGGSAFGPGGLDDTWLWDGSNWARQTPSVVPPPRGGHALAWDATRDRVVLFGGNNGVSDTWEWDGVNWAQASPSTSPPAREEHALAFDRVRQRTVLFGGKQGNALAGDTWEWDGSTWVQRVTATAPTPRHQHAMAFDALRGRTILFGGGEESRWNAETWEWDGTVWAQRQPTTSPPAGVGWMVFDEQLQKVVLFDGRDVWVFLP